MIDIISKKKYFFALSIVLILIGVIFYFVNGVQMDIQFAGGTRIMIPMDDADFSTSEVEVIAEKTLGKQVMVQQLQTYNPNAEDKLTMLSLGFPSKETLTNDENNLIIQTITENFNVNEDEDIEILSVEPSIGGETFRKGMQAAVIAIVLIVLFVAWRFSVMSGFMAALMAIVALIHDTLMMLGVYTVFKLPLNDVFIAALLVILGYSLNDTIVIYDRIRENTHRMKKANLEEIVNVSIYQSLARSINTTLTSLICIVTLYIFASINHITSLKEFSLPLIIGMTSGAYSSIFIASPLWMLWRERSLSKNTKKA